MPTCVWAYLISAKIAVASTAMSSKWKWSSYDASRGFPIYNEIKYNNTNLQDLHKRKTCTRILQVLLAEILCKFFFLQITVIFYWSYSIESMGLTILQGVKFPIFLLILPWALQQCSTNALLVITEQTLVTADISCQFLSSATVHWWRCISTGHSAGLAVVSSLQTCTADFCLKHSWPASDQYGSVDSRQVLGWLTTWLVEAATSWSSLAHHSQQHTHSICPATDVTHPLLLRAYRDAPIGIGWLVRCYRPIAFMQLVSTS